MIMNPPTQQNRALNFLSVSNMLFQAVVQKRVINALCMNERKTKFFNEIKAMAKQFNAVDFRISDKKLQLIFPNGSIIRVITTKELQKEQAEPKIIFHK